MNNILLWFSKFVGSFSFILVILHINMSGMFGTFRIRRLIIDTDSRPSIALVNNTRIGSSIIPPRTKMLVEPHPVN